MIDKLKINEQISLLRTGEKKWEVRIPVKYNGGSALTGTVYAEGETWFYLPEGGRIPVKFPDFGAALRWLREN